MSTQISRHSSRQSLAICLFLIALSVDAAGILQPPCAAYPASVKIPQAATQAPVAKQVGVIKSIEGNTITLTTDAGVDISVQVVSNAKMVRVAPGQTDLKSAAAIQLSDLHVADRILVRGQASPDGKSFVAAGVIAMSRSDVEAKQQHDREDWQKRGIGGLVSSVDPGAGTIAISVTSPGGAKTIAVHSTKATILRRYAPDSILFDDAKPAPLDQIKPGDQLRARGARSADGNDFAAEEVVSGTFRNIAGTISAIDSNAGTMSVMDLITKKPFAVKITRQSQLRRLPAEAAQRIAFRLKGPGTGAAAPQGGAAKSHGESVSANGGGQCPGDAGSGRAAGGQADFQQIVNRMPAATLADFKKDDAVMIVATEGTASGQVTAITVLGGVESILAAAPAGSQAMTLSPWSLGGVPAVGGDTP
ncbi:MAG: hypothetical protein WB987_04655 [Candidatus Acidiferrales bacterium]